jgi:hypothetical protein
MKKIPQPSRLRLTRTLLLAASLETVSILARRRDTRQDGRHVPDTSFGPGAARRCATPA